MDENQLKNLSPQQREELMRTVQAQVSLANMQEMLTVIHYILSSIESHQIPISNFRKLPTSVSRNALLHQHP